MQSGLETLAGGFTTVFSSDDRNSGTTDDFTINLNPNMDLTGADRHEICLGDVFTWYTWFNISTEYNNTQFRYSTDGGNTFTTLDLTPGIYSADDLINLISAGMIGNNHLPSNILISPNENSQRFIFTFTNNHQVDFTNMPIRTLFGAASQVYSVSGPMPEVAKMTNGVNTWLLHCDLLNSGYTGQFQGRVLYSFSPDVAPGSAIRESPQVSYCLVRPAQFISSVRFWLTDQQGRRINLNGEPLSVRLHWKPLRDVKYRDI